MRAVVAYLLAVHCNKSKLHSHKVTDYKIYTASKNTHRGPKKYPVPQISTATFVK